MQRITRTGTRLAALSVALLVGACGGGNSDRQAGSDTTSQTPASISTSAAQTGRASGMGGMAGIHGAMQGGSMVTMDSMAAQMKRMDHMRPAQLQAVMPMHRQMTANMLMQMTDEMRSMNMTASSEWNATIDSIRQDLVHMPDMSAQALKDFLPAHQERVQRLMDMHRTMMGGMQPRP